MAVTGRNRRLLGQRRGTGCCRHWPRCFQPPCSVHVGRPFQADVSSVGLERPTYTDGAHVPGVYKIPADGLNLACT